MVKKINRFIQSSIFAGIITLFLSCTNSYPGYESRINLAKYEGIDSDRSYNSNQEADAAAAVLTSKIVFAKSSDPDISVQKATIVGHAKGLALEIDYRIALGAKPGKRTVRFECYDEYDDVLAALNYQFNIAKNQDEFATGNAKVLFLFGVVPLLIGLFPKILKFRLLVKGIEVGPDDFRIDFWGGLCILMGIGILLVSLIFILQ